MSSVSRSVGRPVARSVLAGQLNNLTQLIKSLFSLGEQGFAYDPNDLTTLYKDAAGTIPVTAAGQPVGLMKDKSGRNNHAYQTVSASRPILQQTPILGNELVVNGDFSNGTVGWTPNGATLNNISGELEIVNTAGGPSARQVLNTQVGKTYAVSFNLRRGTTGNINLVRVGTSTGGVDLLSMTSAFVSGKYTAIFTAATTTSHLSFGYGETAAGQTSYWDNISIKEITGYRTDQKHIEYDGVDDKLFTNLPAQLTGCTVVRSVPNVGTQILTGQTIPTTYNDNINNCGLIVINRALTASETSQITKLFNKAAGV